MSHNCLLKQLPSGGRPRAGMVTGMFESTKRLHL